MRGSRDRLAPLLLAAIVTWLTVASGAWAGDVLLGSAAPEIAGGPWINSTALTTAALRGKVALVEFWTYG
ncbi:MAG TPA: hypothetical protein VMS64_35145 [Candidatus Methylomirabilis sp.]|nr:hypothetical protein [Candidatus Methylomirabilis sp.]